MKSSASNLNRFRNIKEAGLFAYLSKLSLAEGLLDDDVEQSVHDVVIFHLCLRELLSREILLGFDIDQDSVIDVAERYLESNVLIQVGSGEYISP